MLISHHSFVKHSLGPCGPSGLLDLPVRYHLSRRNL